MRGRSADGLGASRQRRAARQRRRYAVRQHVRRLRRALAAGPRHAARPRRNPQQRARLQQPVLRQGRRQAHPAGRASRGPRASRDRPRMPLRQRGLHHADRRPEQARKRIIAGDAVPPLRVAGVPMPPALGRRRAGTVGQSLRPAPRGVRLLATPTLRPSRHDRGDKPIAPRGLSPGLWSAGR